MEKRALSAKVRLLKGLGSPFLDPQVFLGRPDSHSRTPIMLICPHYRKIGTLFDLDEKRPSEKWTIFFGAPRPDNPSVRRRRVLFFSLSQVLGKPKPFWFGFPLVFSSSCTRSPTSTRTSSSATTLGEAPAPVFFSFPFFPSPSLVGMVALGLVSRGFCLVVGICPWVLSFCCLVWSVFACIACFCL